MEKRPSNRAKLLKKIESTQWKLDRCHSLFRLSASTQEKAFWGDKIQMLHSQLVTLYEEFEAQETVRLQKLMEENC